MRVKIKNAGFAKLLTASTFAYILCCSIFKIENSIAYIGFLISLVTFWATPPGAAPPAAGKDSDPPDPRW